MESKNMTAAIKTAAAPAVDINAQTAALVNAVSAMTIAERIATLVRVNPVTGKPALFYIKPAEWTAGNKEASARLRAELLYVNVSLAAAIAAHGTPTEKARRDALERSISGFYTYAQSMGVPAITADNYRADVRYVIRYAIASRKLDASGNLASTVVSSATLFNLLQICMYVHIAKVAFPGVTLGAADAAALVKAAEKDAAKKSEKPAPAKKNRGKKESKPAPDKKESKPAAAPAKTADAKTAAPAPAEKAAG